MTERTCCPCKIHHLQILVKAVWWMSPRSVLTECMRRTPCGVANNMFIWRDGKTLQGLQAQLWPRIGWYVCIGAAMLKISHTASADASVTYVLISFASEIPVPPSQPNICPMDPIMGRMGWLLELRITQAKNVRVSHCVLRMLAAFLPCHMHTPWLAYAQHTASVIGQCPFTS